MNLNHMLGKDVEVRLPQRYIHIIVCGKLERMANPPFRYLVDNEHGCAEFDSRSIHHIGGGGMIILQGDESHEHGYQLAEY